jgi:hypothetical protein
MAIAREITFASLDELFLDPTNPRLGRRVASRDLPQERVLQIMRDWTLDELAVSFIESGFWPHEALIVVEEELYGEPRLVVVEGNRRLAALRYLAMAAAGEPPSRKWREIVEATTPPDDLFTHIPTIQADARKDVEAFLGFRHVTGIKEWNPAEKAEYVAKLIDDDGLSYEQVMRTIGSKTEPVRRNYIAYRILLQLDDLEGVSVEHVEEKFSVLFLSLREVGVQRFLSVDIQSPPDAAAKPVPDEKLQNLADFATWLFGTTTRPPLFTDSRNVGRFARVLESDDAVEYLRETRSPSFQVASQKAGADEPELVRRVETATDEIEQTLSRVHLHVDSEELRKAVDRFGRGALELLRRFPDIYDEIVGGDD